jgi:hypothetical protein
VDAGHSAVVQLPGGGRLEVAVTAGGFVPRGRLADVVAAPAETPGCAVAVGRWDGPRGGAEAGRWASADCTTFTGPGPFTGEPPGDGLPSDDQTRFTGLAARPQGDFVVVGYREERADDFPSDMSIAVMDAGAATLARVAAPEPTGSRAHQAAEDVIVTQAGTVLVTGVDGPIGGTSSVWRSTDLAAAAVPADDSEKVPATWERVPLPSASADVVYAETSEILQRADGTLVVVGGSGTTQDVREEDPAAWVSTDDGRTWTAAPPVGTFGPEGPMRRVTGVAELDGGGLVAVGRFGDGGCLWRSDDGLSWSAEGVGGPCGGPWTADVVASDRGVVVVGSSVKIGPPAPGDDRRGVVWYSADGASWTRVRLASGAASGAFASATGFVVLGDGSDGYVGWTARVDVLP